MEDKNTLEEKVRKYLMNTCCEHNHGTFTQDRDCRVQQIIKVVTQAKKDELIERIQERFTDKLSHDVYFEQGYVRKHDIEQIINEVMK